MKLSDYEFLPGVVIDNDDPERIGRVKATVPTWFDTNTMDKESLPWIYPFCMFGNQTFSKMPLDRKIWVFHNKENYLEYWYVPMFEMNGQTREIVQKYDNPEVLVSQMNGSSNQNLLVSYNDSEGLDIRVGSTLIKIGSNKEIHITNGKSSFSVTDKGVMMGNGNGKHYPTVLGPKVKDMFSAISQKCKEIYTLAEAESWTISIADPFKQLAEKIDTINKDVLSETILVSDSKKTSNS